MKYYFAEATFNTFLLFDCLEQTKLDTTFLRKAGDLLITEGRDDVLIMLSRTEKEEALYAHLAVLGQDGRWGEFCGNGARACAAYLFATYPEYKQFFLVTQQGVHQIEHKSGEYTIHLPSPCFSSNPKFIRSREEIETKYGCYYVEILEPHLVYPGKLSDGELLALGRELNSLKNHFPQGINVNAYYLRDDGSLDVKTYERGVQRLTRSCGTGSVACVAFAYREKYLRVQVVTSGGILEIELQENGVSLTGSASFETEVRFLP